MSLFQFGLSAPQHFCVVQQEHQALTVQGVLNFGFDDTLPREEARRIVGRTHRQSNEKNSTGCGKTSGLWETRCGPKQTRGQLRCPEASDPQQESVVLILLNRNLDWMTGNLAFSN